MIVSTAAAAYPIALLLSSAPSIGVQQVEAVQSVVVQQQSGDASATPAPQTSPDPQPTTDDSTATAQSAEASGDIVVTGSRIARRDYSSSSPLVTVGAPAIQATGAPTLEQTLNTLPQLASSASSSANTTSRGGQASANLRGLGQQRTLVLVDGKRMQPSNPDGSIDLNTLPTQLIDSVEIITGGASAVYGSDAVTGVVNLKLRTNLKGIEAYAQNGFTEYGDGATYDVSLIGGTKLLDDRLRLTGSIAYSKRDSVLFPGRDYLLNQAISTSLIQTRINSNAANLPSQAAVNAVFARYGVAAGTVARTTPFYINEDGTLFRQANPVNFRGTSDPDTAIAEGQVAYFTGNGFYAQTPLERVSGFGRADFDVTDNFHVYAQGLYTTYNVTTQIVPSVLGSTTSIQLVVPTTNPFIPADLRQVLASRPQPGGSFTITKRLSEAGIRRDRYDYDVYQGQIGASGKLVGDLAWDVTGAYGETKLSQELSNYQSSGAFNRLLAAADGGNSLCAGGFNPFGNARLSQACIDFVTRTPENRTKLERGYVLANLTGTILTLPAGDLKFAAGAEYRKDSFVFTPAPDIASGDIAGFLPIAASRGSTNVKEIYGEALIPLFRNAFFADEFNLDVAYRYSDYNTIGGVSTYKGDVDWVLTQGIRLRGGYSRATRAPSVGELYAPQQFSRATLGNLAANGGDACDIRSGFRTGSAAAQVRALCLAQGVPANIIDTFTNINTQTNNVTAGNVDLREEVADTYSAGVVFKSPFTTPLLSRLTLSVDYYNIQLKGAIGTINNQLAIQRCFNSNGDNPSYSNTTTDCALITRDTTSGQIDVIRNPTFNLGGYKTDGIDVALDWAIDLNEAGLGNAGRVSLNSVVNYLNKFEIQTVQGRPFLDYVDTLGNTQIDPFATAHPRWKATTSATYSLSPFSIMLRWRYLDGMKNASNVGTTLTNPPIKAVSYFDLNTDINVTDRFSLTLGVVNLRNRKPPVVNRSVIGDYYTDLYTYDLIGRRFFVAAKARF